MTFEATNKEKNSLCRVGEQGYTVVFRLKEGVGKSNFLVKIAFWNDPTGLFKGNLYAKLVHITNIALKKAFILQSKANFFSQWTESIDAVFCYKTSITNITFEVFFHDELMSHDYSISRYIFAKLPSQTLHLKGFFPSWTENTCLFKSLFCTKEVCIRNITLEMLSILFHKLNQCGFSYFALP